MNGGKIFGNINLGSGFSNISMKNESGVKGNIVATGNEANIVDLTNSTIGGKLSLGSGNNTIKLNNNSGILAGMETGVGNDNLIVNDSIIKGKIDLGSGDNIINLKNNSLLIGNIISKEDDDTVILNNSQIQGNIDLGSGNNKLIIDSNSYIFGNINLGSGNDEIILDTNLKTNKYFNLNVNLGFNNKDEVNTISIGNNSYLEGSIKGSEGSDTIKIGKNEVSNNIINLSTEKIENITIQGNSKILSSSKLFADKIIIEKGHTYLELNVDINKNNIIHKEHGLYGNIGSLETNNKNNILIIDSSKINNNSVIAMTGNILFNNEQIKSDSLLHSVFKDENGNIQVIIDSSLPTADQAGNGLPGNGVDGSYIRYDELNQVYQSIYTAKKIGYLAQNVNLSDKEKDEAFKSLLSFLNQIYANNIYGYAPKLSIDSMDLYKKSILNTSNKLSKDDVLVKGTFLYAHREKQNDTHGRNFYGWDNGIERFNVSTNTEGLMTSIEKGLTENQTIGIDFGASKQQSKISNSSTLDANSLYLGVHNIYEKGMFKAVFGVGMQTNMYEGERDVKTKYSFSKNNTDFSTLSHNIYLDTSYNFKLNNNVSLIPYYDFTTNIVHMESIKENYTDSSLAISTDKEKVFVIENEIGLKVQTEALTDNTKYKMSAGIAYINRSGNTDYDLKGRIVGGSDFTILGENIEHNNIKGDINFDVEQENGIFYNLNFSTEYGEYKRKTYKAQLGIGYRF